VARRKPVEDEDDDDDVIEVGEGPAIEVDRGRGARVVELVYEGPGGERIDAWVAARIEDLSREGVVRLLDAGRVTVGGERVPKRHPLAAGERVVVDIPPPVAIACKPEKIPLSVRFEDEHLLVIEKARGMLTHPVGRHVTGTLVNALLGHCNDLSGIGGALRPGIVHRLDRETSGLMVVAKNDRAHRGLSAQFQARSVEKVYLAIAHGALEHGQGRIEAPIGRDPKGHDRRRVDAQRGKPAVSEYRVVSRHGALSLVEVLLLTGRTHQIRLHMAYLRHPIFGDHLYGRRADAAKFAGVALHSHRLGFTHPVTRAKLKFESPLPADMARLLDSQK
jgi:23S rRNA pseudouridine1911/1915/1917 synthase